MVVDLRKNGIYSSHSQTVWTEEQPEFTTGIVKRAILATLLAPALAVTTLFALGYGWVPLAGDEQIEPYLGAVPDGFIAHKGPF